MRIFFSLIIVLFLHPVLASCPHESWQQTVTLKTINDGDTVTLVNGRLVRLIGINTPEINHRKLSQSEPFAIEAKELLAKYIKEGDKLHLVFDKTRQDKYGRLLAYVYSKTGRNLALLQLQAGLAQHWVIGKNDRLWECFQEAELQARIRKKGIWSDFSPLGAASLKEKNKGYVYISGMISHINKDSKGLQFLLDRRLTVKINPKHMKLFTDNDLDFSLDKRLLLSGKLIFSQGKPYLMLYHPAQILPVHSKSKSTF